MEPSSAILELAIGPRGDYSMQCLLRITFLSAVLLCTFQVGAYQEINKGISGSWYNPDQSGHGLAIEVAENGKLVAYWYTYDFWGNPLWLIGTGDRSGNTAIVDFYYVSGMVFGEFDPDTTDAMFWGQGFFEFQSCDQGVFSWDSGLSYESGESFGEGEIPISRLAYIEDIDCQNETPVGGSTPMHVVSRVIEEFEGWDGGTVVELDNGQMWQQVDYQFEYYYQYRPRIVIFEDLVFGGPIANVEGTSKWIQVERLR